MIFAENNVLNCDKQELAESFESIYGTFTLSSSSGSKEIWKISSHRGKKVDPFFVATSLNYVKQNEKSSERSIRDTW